MTEYYKKIQMKTAVFLASCCRLGGILAGLKMNDIEALTDYGMNLGLAFQIVDDLLDFFGDANKTGKALGGDLKSGVITLPVIRTLETSGDSGTLHDIATKGKVSDSDISKAIEIMKSANALDYCKMRAYAHIEAAKINLPDSINSSSVITLGKVADFVIDRTW